MLEPERLHSEPGSTITSYETLGKPFNVMPPLKAPVSSFLKWGYYYLPQSILARGKTT